MKRIVSIFTVLAILFTLMPPQAFASSNSISLDNEVYQNDNIRIFQSGDWTHSIAINDNTVVLCAVDSTGTIYQKVFSNNSFNINSISNDDIEGLFNDFFANLDSVQKFESTSYPAISPMGLDYNYMVDLLHDAEGTGYVNSIVHMTQYQGKNFEIREGKDVGSPIRSSDLCETFKKSAAVGSIVTFFVNKGVFVTVGTILSAIGLVGDANTILPRDVQMDVYHASAVTHRATYTSGVSYEINYTSKANHYMFFVDVYSSSSVYPQMILDYTEYQHGSGYFDNFSAQIQDAYNNYYG